MKGTERGSCTRKSSVYRHKGVRPDVTSPQRHSHFPRVKRNMGAELDQVRDYGSQAPAPDRAGLRLLMAKGFLADHPKQIEGNHRKLQHQRIGGELAGGQALHVHVGLQLAVVLLAFSMGVVRFDDFVVSPAEVRPPGVHFNVGNQQYLAVLVDGALDNLVDNPQRLVRGSFPGYGAFDALPGGTDIDGLALPGMPDVLAARLHLIKPGILRLLPKVPLDDDRCRRPSECQGSPWRRCRSPCGSTAARRSPGGPG